MKVNHHILSQPKSLEELISSGKSLIRFGDGEATIIEGGHLYFQRNSADLMRRMRSIIQDYAFCAPYLIALPPEAMAPAVDGQAPKKNLKIWRKSGFIFSRTLPKSGIPPVLDAMMFREDTLLSNADISRIWVDYNTIYFVHSNYKYFIDFCSISKNQKIKFINISSANAYSNAARALTEITQHAKTLSDGLSSAIALVSGGPAGKVIVAELAMRGIRGVDVGHYFDYKFYDIRRDRSS